MNNSPDPFDALYDELEATGQWYCTTPDGPEGNGRVVVQRSTCGGYGQRAEILRTFDGRGWVIYAVSECPTCLRQRHLVARPAGTEIDLVASVNRAGLDLGDPEYAPLQHTTNCSQGLDEADDAAESDDRYRDMP